VVEHRRDSAPCHSRWKFLDVVIEIVLLVVVSVVTLLDVVVARHDGPPIFVAPIVVCAVPLLLGLPA